MSIEQLLKENTEAVKALTALLGKGKGCKCCTPTYPQEILDKIDAAAEAYSNPKDDALVTKVAEAIEQHKVERLESFVTSAIASNFLVTAGEDTPKELTYQTVRDLILEMAGEHREAIKVLNAQYGLTKFAEVLEDPKDATSKVLKYDLMVDYHQDLLKLKG